MNTSDKTYATPGYLRRRDAARFLGISLRTLSEWQRARVVPFIRVSHRITLFKLTDLERAMERFTIKAVGS